MTGCPGTDSRALKIELKKCPHCGYAVEMFSDEVAVRCPSCKKEITREKTPSCISWCKHARECLGEERWRALQSVSPAKDGK